MQQQRYRPHGFTQYVNFSVQTIALDGSYRRWIAVFREVKADLIEFNHPPWSAIQTMIDHPLLIPMLILLSLLLAGALAASRGLMRRSSDATTTTEHLNPDQLPRALRKSIELQDSKFLSAGFTHAADLRTNRRGVKCVARHYLSHDQLTMAEVAVHQLFGITMGGVNHALTTALSDGAIIQSSHHETVPAFFADLSAEDKVVLLATGTTDPGKLLRMHTEFVAAQCDGKRHPLPIRPQFIPELNEYIYQLCDWYLHRKGTLPDPPPTMA